MIKPTFFITMLVTNLSAAHRFSVRCLLVIYKITYSVRPCHSRATWDFLGRRRSMPTRHDDIVSLAATKFPRMPRFRLPWLAEPSRPCNARPALLSRRRLISASRPRCDHDAGNTTPQVQMLRNALAGRLLIVASDNILMMMPIEEHASRDEHAQAARRTMHTPPSQLRFARHFEPPPSTRPAFHIISRTLPRRFTLYSLNTTTA